MTTETKTRKTVDDESPLKRFLRESGLKYRAVSARATIQTDGGPRELSQSVFYAIVGGDRPVRIDEAHAIVMALRAMTGQPVTIEQLWPNGDKA